MTVSQALALGVLQGATEFLPVSSSGHLALAENLLPGSERPSLVFDTVLHLATLLAIVLILRARILSLLKAALSFVTRPERIDETLQTDRRWLGMLVVASVPTALIGFSMRGLVGEAREHPSWIGAALLVTAVLLLFSERIGKRDRGSASLNMRDALWIGAVQGFAVMPGISRSGSTVAAALFRNVSATTAVEFSMLVSIPAIVGANLLELTRGGLGAIEPVPFAVGFSAAFATGVFSLKALQWLVAERRLLPFAVYCALVGVGAMVLG